MTDSRAEPEVRCVGVSLDCAEPVALAEFYRGLLGGRLLWSRSTSVGVQTPGLLLVAQRVADYQPPTWPGASVVHLDLTAGCQLDRAERRAVALGAQLVDPQPDARWRVLLDPAGHPFCITTMTPDAESHPINAPVVLQADRAGRADLEQLLAIAAARRRDYEDYQPQFWRPAGDAVARQRDFFSSLLDDEDTLLAVARAGSSVRGFAIARTAEAPPVYDPGGRTCVVDDFAVVDPGDWPTVGPLLLGAVRTWGSDHGAVQLVVVVARLDQAKRDMLRAAQLDIASEWWVAPIPG